MQYRIAAAVIASLGSAGIAAAQVDQPGGLSTGTPIEEGQASDEIGAPYVAEVFDAWEKRCVRQEDGNDPCQIYQLIGDGSGGSVAEFTVFLFPEGGGAVAGATIVTPLETLLTEQVTVRVDGGPAKRYPFTFCAQAGCVSRIALTDEDLAAFRAGAKAEIRIVPAVAPDQEVWVEASLAGFTAGFASLRP